MSETTAHMIKCMAPLASHITLRKSDEFWDASRTLQELADGRYFDPASGSGQGANGGSVAENKRFTHWPPILRAIVEGGKDGAMALSALGGATWHTRRALIDHDLLSMRRFGAYIPPDLKQAVQHAQGASCGTPGSTNDTQEDDGLPDSSALPGSSIESPAQSQSHMILDGVTLSNLEIIRNTYDGGEKGSLWAFVNRCSTAFGRRLLKDWVMKPLLHLRSVMGVFNDIREVCPPNISTESLRRPPCLPVRCASRSDSLARLVPTLVIEHQCKRLGSLKVGREGLVSPLAFV